MIDTISNYDRLSGAMLGGLGLMADRAVGEGGWDYATAVYVDFTLSDGRHLAIAGFGAQRRNAATAEDLVDLTPETVGDETMHPQMEQIFEAYQQELAGDIGQEYGGPAQVVVLDITIGDELDEDGKPVASAIAVPLWSHKNGEVITSEGAPDLEELVRQITADGQAMEWPRVHQMIQQQVNAD